VIVATVFNIENVCQLPTMSQSFVTMLSSP